MGQRKRNLENGAQIKEVGLRSAWHKSVGSISGQISFPHADDFKPNIAAVPPPFSLSKKKTVPASGRRGLCQGRNQLPLATDNSPQPVCMQRRDTAICSTCLYRSRPTCTCALWHEVT